MDLFNKKQFEIPTKENYEKSNNIINKLDNILKDQAEISREISKINHRLDEIEKQINVNTDAHSEELALLKEIIRKNIAVPQTTNFPIKSDKDLTNLEQNIQKDFEKYVSVIKIITTSGGLVENFKKILDMPIILAYNYDGTQKKKAFKDFKLLNMAIFEATKVEGSNEKDYRRNIRHCFKVHKARHFRKISYNRKVKKTK